MRRERPNDAASRSIHSSGGPKLTAPAIRRTELTVRAAVVAPWPRCRESSFTVPPSGSANLSQRWYGRAWTVTS